VGRDRQQLPAENQFALPGSASYSGIFILSDNRSGSTLLDQCLGAHSALVSLGELHWLRAYALEDRTLYDPAHPLVCSCGRRLAECPFWSAVRDALGRPLESLELRMRGARRLIRTHPRLFRRRLIRNLFRGRRVVRDSVALFQAVLAVAGRAHCVDSSKLPVRFRAIYDEHPDRAKAIVLVRDFRAVVHSKMKRGMRLEPAALGWRRKMRQIEALTGDLPPTHVRILKYEDFCRQPARELAGLCEFIGIEFEEGMLRRQAARTHHIGGSPSKFDESRREISLDESAAGHFSDAQVADMRAIIGDVAERWGY
jgi:hypothetical protein